MKRYLCIGILGAVFGGGTPPALRADAGHDAWLRYAPLEAVTRARYESLPSAVVVLGDSAVLAAARNEMLRGILGMLGRTLRRRNGVRERAIVLGTLTAVRNLD